MCEYLFGGNGSDFPFRNLSLTSLGLFYPSLLHTDIRRPIQIGDQGTDQLCFILLTQQPDLRLDRPY